MSRDIVYKIWNKESKIMESSKVGVYSKLRHVLNIHAESRFSSCDNKAYPDNYIALQFTGMYDTTKYEELTDEEKKEFRYEYPYNKHDIDLAKEWKGKPIYEGDIALVTINFLDEEVIPKFESGIYYDENDACFSVKVEHRGEIGTYPLCMMGANLKVIGNEFQNPELLKAKDRK